MSHQLSHGSNHVRPRTLGTAGALFHLDGDWGTSLAYILPIILALAGRLSPIYLCVIGFVMFVVASGYKIVCAQNPDGGGVYSSLRKLGNTGKKLAVVGALLLLADYVITIALSVADSYHYLQIDGTVEKYAPKMIASGSLIWTLCVICFLVAINWKGPHNSAKFAGVASSSTFFLAGLLSLVALPLVPAGLAHIGSFTDSVPEAFRNLTGTLLALSGVEAVSNMTGVMKDPVMTSRKAMNLELTKVLFTTIVLGIAMNGLPDQVKYLGRNDGTTFVYQTEQKEDTSLPCYVGKTVAWTKGASYTCAVRELKVARPDMLVAMGQYLVPGLLGHIFGILIGLAYGALLIFAGNTAMIDISQVLWAMAQDGEMPAFYITLNDHGVPVWGLVTAGVVPAIVILLVGAHVEALAALYAIGVAGAVSMNLTGTALHVTGRDRLVSGFGAIMMSGLFVALAYYKMEATTFATIVVTSGLSIRWIGQYSGQIKAVFVRQPAYNPNLDMLAADPGKEKLHKEDS